MDVLINCLKAHLVSFELNYNIAIKIINNYVNSAFFIVSETCTDYSHVYDNVEVDNAKQMFKLFDLYCDDQIIYSKTLYIHQLKTTVGYYTRRYCYSKYIFRNVIPP